MTTAVHDTGFSGEVWQDGSLYFWSVTCPADQIIDGGVTYTEGEARRVMVKALGQEVDHAA